MSMNVPKRCVCGSVTGTPLPESVDIEAFGTVLVRDVKRDRGVVGKPLQPFRAGLRFDPVGAPQSPPIVVLGLSRRAERRRLHARGRRVTEDRRTVACRVRGRLPIPSPRGAHGARPGAAAGSQQRDRVRHQPPRLGLLCPMPRLTQGVFDLLAHPAVGRGCPRHRPRSEIPLVGLPLPPHSANSLSRVPTWDTLRRDYPALPGSIHLSPQVGPFRGKVGRIIRSPSRQRWHRPRAAHASTRSPTAGWPSRSRQRSCCRFAPGPPSGRPPRTSRRPPSAG